ncbi:MAG: hypothetical protein K2K39_02635 [Clostridia bacterium]|nr:hypothetical protein [Clostridia bacterium]
MSETEVKDKTEYGENCEYRFVETIGGGLGALVSIGAAVLLVLYLVYREVDTGAVVSIIISLILTVILEIACVRMFIAGLNEFYNHGKTGLVIGEYGVQIAVRTKLFERELVFVPYSDMQKFCVYRDRWKHYHGDPYKDLDLNLKPYKVTVLKKGWITFCDLCGIEYSIHIKECMSAGAQITAHLDESQINRGKSDIRKGRKKSK